MALNIPPETRRRLAEARAAHDRRVAEIAVLSDSELADYLEHNLANCWTLFRFRKGEPVYEATLKHVLIPEIVARLRAQASR